MKTLSNQFRLAQSVGAVAFAALITGCGKEEINVYSVPKEHFQSSPAPGVHGGGGYSSSDPLQWETPEGWQELPRTGIRLGNFLVSEGDKKAEVSIISLPGRAGTELENVNVWRGEIGLQPITERELISEMVSVGDERAKLFDLPGKENQIIGVILPRGGSSWFFKMRGHKEVVAKNKSKLVALLNSVHFHDDDDDSDHSAHATNVAEKPISTNVEEIPAAPKSDSPWDIPAGWRETAPTAMVLKNYSVGEGAREAKIAISRFPGDVGGLLANVNRWRNQLSLDNIGAGELPNHTTTIDVLGGKATLVDMKGTDSNTGQPARMVAASVPRDGQTWFYKMMGDDATVGREKEAFIKMVQTARYP